MRVSAAPLRFVAVALLTLWGLAIVGFFLSSSSRTDFDVRDMRRRVDFAESAATGVERENSNLRDMLLNIGIEGSKGSFDGGGPSLEYELRRREVRRGVDELWRLLRHKLKDREDGLLSDVRHRYLAIVSDLEKMTEADGHEEWRKKESEELSSVVQGRIDSLQNPESCSPNSRSTRLLSCDLNKSCGFGCQMHHATYCLLVAMGSDRTLWLKSDGWSYDRKGGYEDVFLPMSETCRPTSKEFKSVRYWPGKPEDQVVELPVIDSMHTKPAYLPPAVPSELSPRLRRLHGSPGAWWAGQALSALMRPGAEAAEAAEAKKKRLGFRKAGGGHVVGMHVRRSDKLNGEASYHSVDEYMLHVEEYFDLQEVKSGEEITERTVFVATDEQEVLRELNEGYSHRGYKFLGDEAVARAAGSRSKRYERSSLFDLIGDVTLLAESDFIVCTFSSQVCRLAYELMQTKHPDASEKYRSLDDLWYFGGGLGRQHLAAYDHRPLAAGGEIELSAGDVLGVAGNHWDGLSKGSNQRNRQRGLYPSYKAREMVREAEFPPMSGKRPN